MIIEIPDDTDNKLNYARNLIIHAVLASDLERKDQARELGVSTRVLSEWLNHDEFAIYARKSRFNGNDLYHFYDENHARWKNKK